MSGILAPTYGQAAPAVPPGVVALADYTIASANESASFKLTATGDVYKDEDGSGYADTGDNWVTPTAAAPGFEVRATLVSGNVAAGVSSALSTWLPLSADQKWKCKLASPTNPSPTCVLSIEIRPVGGAVVDSATINMSATYVP